MKRTLWMAVACLLGGLMVVAVAGGLQGAARAAGAEPAPARAMSPGATVVTREVVINEVAWSGTAASSADEWIELYNNSDHDVDLAGWSIVAADGTPHISLSGVVSAHGYFLLERTDDSTVSDVPADLIYTGGMENDPSAEVLMLYDAADRVVDTANGGGGSWPAGSGSPGYYSMERRDPAAPDTDGNWCANDGITRNGKDAGGGDVNGTPKAQNSCYQPPAEPTADLVVLKTGPAAAAPGSVITYTITLGNAGAATAAGTLLTDALPAATVFVTQSSPFSFSRPGGALLWEAGDVPTGTQYLVTVAVRVTDTAFGPITNWATATTTAGEADVANNAAGWTTSVGGSGVLISAVLYDGYQDKDPDEAVQLINVDTAPVDLTGWELCKDAGSGLSCRALPSLVLSPAARVWLARDAVSFTVSFGFPPDYEMGSWLSSGLSNTGDEVVLRDDGGSVVDAVVYEGGTAVSGWSGPAVEPYGVGRAEGQILYRIPDEVTGLPIADTDTAADWIQAAGNVTHGRRVLYPGWHLDPLFWPLTATEPATVVVGIAPDNGFDVISQTIARAQHTISIEVYSLRHPQVITQLVQKAQAGVSVTVLLEGGPALVGADSARWQQELWACQEIEAAGGQCWFMIHEPGDDLFSRYEYLHAKFLVVDGEWVVITSQNLTDTGLPSDDKSNGTYGSRGVVVATNAPSVVARVSQVFAMDLDLAHYNDLVRWNTAYTDTYGPPAVTYVPQLTVTDHTTTPVYFDAPLVVFGVYDFELFTAPEAALRRSGALLGLVARAGAGDAVYVAQMYEHVDWGDDPADDPNLRLEAYIAAARRGATVRILLNKGTFGGPDFGTPNTATVAYVNQIARVEGLDLRAALGDPTHYGIHNKMVLVWLHDPLDGGGYAHVGSINGSEGSSKVNREMAIQIHSDEVYAYLKEMFDMDWQQSRPLYLPLAMRRYTPPADHLLISEVDYQGSCEWVEVYNPTPLMITLTGYKLGDARKAGDYEGMYVFPARQIGPGEVILVANDAAQCASPFMVVDYELFGADPGVPNLARDPNWGTGEFRLGDSGDEVLLLGPTNRPVDVVVYGSGSYPGVIPHGGVDWRDTLERVPANVDTNDCGFDFEPGWSPNVVRLQ